MDMQLTGAAVIFGVTLLVSLAGLYAAPSIIERGLLRPYWLVRRREYEKLITSGFVHADLAHLAFNMITFYFFAFALERRIGSATFVLLYMVALVVSELGTYLKHRDNPDYATLGASGAISAVLFAFIVYYPDRDLYFLLLPVPIPAPLFAVGYLAYTYYSARQARGRINHDAHLGGALTGLAFVAVRDPDAYTRLLQMLGM
jgi:membrane associated rhomboid family serine protease